MPKADKGRGDRRRDGGRPPRGDTTLGLAIELLRTYKGWTQEDLARAMASGNSSISDWETGRVMPRQASIERMLAAVGLDRRGLDLTLRFIGELRRIGGEVARRGGVDDEVGEPAPVYGAKSKGSDPAERLGEGVTELARTFIHELREELRPRDEE